MSNLAIALEGGFGIENLKTVRRPPQAPGPGQVLLKIEAASLNRRDLLLVEGVYNPRQTLPIIPGSDASGVIEAVGPGCERMRVGDRVAMHFFTDWTAGEPDGQKLASALGGPGGDGVLRERMIASEHALVRLPDALSFEAAATLPCAALTAWSAVVELGRTKPGDWVMVQGSGGVSLFALQFAKMLGARVLATTSSQERAARLKALGADEVLDYVANPDWSRDARELAGGRIDLIVEVGGAQTLEASLRSIKPGGTIALVGVLSGAKAAINLPLAVMRQVRLQGVTCGHRESFEAMLRAIDANRIEPVIDSKFALRDAQQAFRHMKSNAHMGKILVLP